MNQVAEIIDSVSGDIATNDVREKIEALEEEWLKLPQVEIPVKEFYIGGMYAREIIIPADTFLTGRIYLEDHYDIMVSGDIVVTSDDGAKILSGFNFFESFRGKKRAGYAITDTRWITICKADLVDGDMLDQISVLKFIELEDHHAADRSDYKHMLSEYGHDEKTVRAQSENESDQIHVESDNCAVNISNINDLGLIASVEILAGVAIMPARIKGMRTMAGRYTNHALIPNAIMVMTGDDINLIAIRNILPGEEITTNYRSTLNMRNSEGLS